jgi:hypothetical protein
MLVGKTHTCTVGDYCNRQHASQHTLPSSSGIFEISLAYIVEVSDRDQTMTGVYHHGP